MQKATSCHLLYRILCNYNLLFLCVYLCVRTCVYKNQATEGYRRCVGRENLPVTHRFNVEKFIDDGTDSEGRKIKDTICTG